MKKNLRIISAAAAALLAVSPVVASGVVNPASSVQAATPINIDLNKSEGLYVRATNKAQSAVSKSDVSGYSLGHGITISNPVDIKVMSGNTGKAANVLKANDPYTVSATVDLHGPAKTEIKINGTSVGKTKATGTLSNVNISIPLHVYDPSAPGEPGFSLKSTGARIENGKVAPITNGVSFESGKSTVSDILNSAKSAVTFVDSLGRGGRITTSVSDVTAELIKQGATIKNGVVTSTNGFNVTLTGVNYSNGRSATVLIPFVPAGEKVTDAPVIQLATKKLGESSFGNPITATSGQTYQIASGTTFNATDFTEDDGTELKFTAVQSDKNNAAATLTSSGSVDTSKPGTWYPVTLTATNDGKKTSSITFNILVAPNGQQEVYSGGATYNIYGDNVQATGSSVKVGDKVYVGDSKLVNNVSYSKISTTSKAAANAGNTWIKTSDLTKPATPAETSESHTVMVTSKAYDKNGNYLGYNYQYTSTINIVPKVVLINGKTYYKVAGKDEYVRVTNITGTPRTLRHNAYIYWSSYRRTPGTGKMYRGQHVTTYGAAIRFKNGKRYYRISGCTPSNKRYIKQANFF